jgi:Stc1 domain-containing protein
MKPIVAFSKHQQQKVGYGIKDIDANHSKMVCMEHAPRPAMEENCDHCNRRLPLDQFSKRTRRLNEFVS